MSMVEVEQGEKGGPTKKAAKMNRTVRWPAYHGALSLHVLPNFWPWDRGGRAPARCAAPVRFRADGHR